MIVGDVMTDDVVTIGPDATLSMAAERMIDHRIGALPVLRNGIIGILTETDIIREARDGERPMGEVPVETAMSTELVTTTPSTSLLTAAETMKQHDIKKLPVEDNGRLVGMATRSDLTTHLHEAFHEIRATERRRDEWT